MDPSVEIKHYYFTSKLKSLQSPTRSFCMNALFICFSFKTFFYRENSETSQVQTKLMIVLLHYTWFSSSFLFFIFLEFFYLNVFACLKGGTRTKEPQFLSRWPLFQSQQPEINFQILFSSRSSETEKEERDTLNKSSILVPPSQVKHKITRIKK